MTTSDFLRDQTERSLRDQTRRRRDGRSRRRQIYLFGGVALIALLILGGPSLISHSSIGRSMLTSTLADYGLEAEAGSMRIGWVTPLQMTGLKIRGSAAGSELSIDQLDIDMTAGDLLADSSLSRLGQISLRGVRLVASVDQGRSSIEDDLKLLINSPGQGGTTTGNIKMQDIGVSITDRSTGNTWRLANGNADVRWDPAKTDAEFDGVLSEPGGQGRDGGRGGSGTLSGSGGSIGGSLTIATAAEPNKPQPWKVDLRTESLPLSVMSLAKLRFPEYCGSIPQRIGGDATGRVVVASTPTGIMEARIDQLRVRNLTAEDETMLGKAGARMWKNDLATLDGELTLTDTRMYGRQLEATTDFAKATMDGAISTTFSLVGTDDNPLRWLEAIDGSATAEIDLAKLDQALPGMLPLRQDAQVLSGMAVGRVDSGPGVPAGGVPVRRSKLLIRSDAVRARAGGRPVMIDPIELSATVATELGRVRAEEFAWKSTFGSAVGQGDLRSGSADVEIDFGRLTAMLRPIVEISEATLAGAATGKIRWNASADDVWRLSGSGDASNILITLPSGQTIRRQQTRAQVDAVGRWGGQSLDELTRASLSVTSNGLNGQAKLVRPVSGPSSDVPIPVVIDAKGRLETISELLGSWLPEQWNEAAGGFTLVADADVSPSAARLTRAKVALDQPQVNYGTRFLQQPSMVIEFAGDLRLPEGDLRAEKLTIAGDAISAAAQGSMSPTDIDMKVKWRADLERLQGSVQTRIAGTQSAPVQSVGFRSAPGGKSGSNAESWLVRGTCEGEFDLAGSDRWIDIAADCVGKDIAVVQPLSAGPAFQTVGPAPSPVSQAARSSASAIGLFQHSGAVVWSEPNVKIVGNVRYDTESGDASTDAFQVAGDWFATTLAGRVAWNDRVGRIQIKGPARLRMNEVAKRLSSLAGISINATGIHETPIEIQIVRQPSGEIAMDVTADLGWESGEVAGVFVGPATIPVQMTETTVTVTPSRVAVGNASGEINLAGQIHYRPGPLWMQLDPGVVARQVQLTPEMTDRWLKYLAPLAANAARIEGTISADIDEAIVVFDNPNQSRIAGQLKIDGVEMNAGPLANQLIGGVDQLKSITSVLIGQPSNPSTNRTLITMPPQTVDFTLDRGVVNHQRMFFDIDRAQVITSGQVALDGRLNMTAQVPLLESWLGRDLQSLVGQSVTLPIDGTLSRPSLDSSGVRQVVAQLGTRAIQDNANNYLQKQLNKQIEKIGLDKIFGN